MIRARGVALLAALLAGGPALSAPVDALDPMARRLYVEGERLEREGELAAAVVRYRAVLDRDPSWHHAVMDIGRVLEALDDPRGAEEIYQRLPTDADAVEALGRLYLQGERHDQAVRQFQRLQRLRPEWSGAVLLEAEATADPQEATELLRAYLAYPDAGLGEPVTDAAVRICRSLWEDGQEEAAHALLDELLTRWPEAVEAEPLAELRAELELSAEARALARASGRPLTPALQGRLHAAREAFAAGALDRAAAELDAVLAAEPRSAQAWAARAGVHEALGEVTRAEHALAMAEVLDPGTAAYPARLGHLLTVGYGGRFAREAADAYRRALLRPGASADLWFHRGRAEQRAGAPVAAAEAHRRYLELAPDGTYADRARAELTALTRPRAAPPEPPAAPARPDDVPEEAWHAFHVGLVLRDRADGEAEHVEEALAQVRAAIDDAPGFVRAVNLEAALLADLGRPDEARARYQASLELDPDQPAVMVLLAELLRDGGDPEAAAALLGAAAEAGSADALFYLARGHMDAWRLFAARELLERYFVATTGGASYAAARALQDEVARRMRGAALLGVAVAAGSLGIPVVVGLRRRTGPGLSALLEEAPGAYRDVARIVSALRHEVLKHDTTVLPAVADAAEAGDADTVRWAADKLYGPDGTVARFRAYVGELQLLGRVHGVRLNLRHRDPVLGPLIRAFNRLSALEADLRSGGGRRTPTQLRSLATELNDTGYRGLGALLRRVCVLPLDADLILDIWSRVRTEPAFRDRPDVDFHADVPEPAVLLRIFRREFDDIAANLLRNTLQVCLDTGAGRMGVVVRTEEDDITGLERVAIRFRDDSPRRLSTAMIRGRYIGRGLGLAVDLVSRNRGSVHVAAEPGWQKAVVVRLPSVELPEEESPCESW